MITRDQLRRTLIAANRESPGNLERVIDAVMGWVENVVAEDHKIDPWSPTGRIDSPVSCRKCDRYLFIGADGEWQHVSRPQEKREASEFVVASDSEPLSEHSPARLYRINEHGHGVLHAQGNLAMMQDLAETLNTKEET